MRLLAAIALLAVLAAGCGEPSSEPAVAEGRREPVARAAPPTERPAPTPRPTADPLAGAVLGAPKGAWVAAKGQPTRALGIYDRFANNLDVLYGQGADGQERVSHLELVLQREEAVDRAREMAKPLHPGDSRSVRTYTAPAGQTVEVFLSSALAEAFAGSSAFGDEEAGTYIQIAQRGQPRTSRVLLALGNRP